MPADEDASLVREIYAAINRHDLAALRDMFAQNMVRHDLAGMLGESNSSAGVTDFLAKLQEALSGLHMEVEDVFANDEGRVAAHATLSGTHEGEFLGAPPTGKKVIFSAITLYQVRDGRVAEAWSLVDWAGALQQMRAT